MVHRRKLRANHFVVIMGQSDELLTGVCQPMTEVFVFAFECLRTQIMSNEAKLHEWFSKHQADGLFVCIAPGRDAMHYLVERGFDVYFKTIFKARVHGENSGQWRSTEMCLTIILSKLRRNKYTRIDRVKYYDSSLVGVSEVISAGIPRVDAILTTGTLFN